MVNGLFKEISEEEMMSVNGGCGGGSGRTIGGINYSVTGVGKTEGSTGKAVSNAISYFSMTCLSPVGLAVGGTAGKVISAISYGASLVAGHQSSK